MRVVVSIDEALYRQAAELADPGMGKADLVREAIRTFVRMRSARRLVLLGGGMSGSTDAARRCRRQPSLPTTEPG